MSWPKGSGIAISRPTRVLVFGKKSELKLVSHIAVTISSAYQCASPILVEISETGGNLAITASNPYCIGSYPVYE